MLALDVAEGLDDLLGDWHGDGTVFCVLLCCGVLSVTCRYCSRSKKTSAAFIAQPYSQVHRQAALHFFVHRTPVKTFIPDPAFEAEESRSRWHRRAKDRATAHLGRGASYEFAHPVCESTAVRVQIAAACNNRNGEPKKALGRARARVERLATTPRGPDKFRAKLWGRLPTHFPFLAGVRAIHLPHLLPFHSGTRQWTPNALSHSLSSHRAFHKLICHVRFR